MDSISIAVTDKICSLAALGRYVVFSEDELLDSFPDGVQKDESTLKRALDFLKDEGYIDLKYSSGNLYCIAPLKVYSPPEPEEERPVEKSVPPPVQYDNTPKLKHIMGAISLSAFVGGAIGSLIVSLIFTFI